MVGVKELESIATEQASQLEKLHNKVIYITYHSFLYIIPPRYFIVSLLRIGTINRPRE